MPAPIPVDPLASLLALKRNAYTTPYGDEISPGVAEAAPGNLLPVDTNFNSNTDRLAAMLNVPSPELDQQRKDLAARESERQQALSENDPAIKEARDQAVAEKLQLAGEPNRVGGQAALAVEKLKADAEQYKADQALQGAQYKADATGKPKLTAAETDLEDKINGINQIIPSLEGQMKTQNPALGSNPNATTGILDWLGAKGHGALYKAGMGGSMADESVQQLSGYLEAVLPRLAASNRLNLRQYNDLKTHVPQVGFTDEENWRRLQVVKQILGSLQTGIDITHGAHMGGAPQSQPPAGFTLDQ